MPKAANIVGNSIKLPPNMAIAGWDIDTQRLMQFCKHFGITHDISFRWTAGYNTVGTHRLEIKNGVRSHRITINQHEDIEFSRDTILHELCHAIQKDTVELSEWKFRRSQERKHYGIRNSPIEVEARQFALDNMEEWGDILY